MLPEPGELFDVYRVERRIGHGGMGVVYAATDTRLHRTVALKVIAGHHSTDPEFVTRFLHEADVLARLDSPHIITIYDSGEVDGSPYIASQHVPGGDLGTLTHHRGPLPPDLVTTLCAQIAEALHDAHTAGIVHRDVKPTNILLRNPDADEPHAYLCDFGIATTDTPDHLTHPGHIAGSWGYLAPERILGHPATPATDTYALGCLLWACLTGGQPPYTGSDFTIGQAHLTAPIPQLPPTTPRNRHLNTVLTTALAKDPTHRHPTTHAFRQHLLGITGAPEPPARPRGGRSALVAAVAVLAVLAASGAAYAVWQGTQPEPDPAPPTAGPTESGGPTEPSGSGRATGTPEPPPGPVVGDLDGDGLGDLAVSTVRGKERALVLTSDGSRLSPAWQGRGKFLHTGDVDGDGSTDLITSRQVPDTPADAYVPIGPEALSGWRGYWGPKIDGRGYYVSGISDVDGDGDDDLVIEAVEEGVGTRVYVAESDDGFEQPRLAAEVGWTYEDSTMLVGDFDADGLADLARIRYPEGEDAQTDLLLLRGDGRRFTASGRPVPMPEYQFATVPGNIDGRPGDELVTYTANGASERIEVRRASRRGFGRSRLWTFTSRAAPAYSQALDVTDLDGDGFGDVVLLATPAKDRRALVWMRSNGERLGRQRVVGQVRCPPRECEYAFGLPE